MTKAGASYEPLQRFPDALAREPGAPPVDEGQTALLPAGHPLAVRDVPDLPIAHRPGSTGPTRTVPDPRCAPESQLAQLVALGKALLVIPASSRAWQWSDHVAVPVVDTPEATTAIAWPAGGAHRRSPRSCARRPARAAPRPRAERSSPHHPIEASGDPFGRCPATPDGTILCAVPVNRSRPCGGFVPVNDMLEAKINHGFTHLDVDGDGLLTEQDHVLMGRRAAAALGHAPDSPQEQRIVDAYLRIWHDLHLPYIPGGGTAISREQFLASTGSLADDPDAARASVGALAEAFLAIADTDVDGRVSPAEYLVFQRGHFPGLTEAEAAEAFEHLDSDGDGYLTAEEFTRACVEFWSSTDPDAPGNWWMGRRVA